MTQEDFIKFIIDAYDNARNLSSPVLNGRTNIQRCRIHSVSSIAEDILSAFAYDILPKYKIFVDCPLTIKTENENHTYYPDIVITKKINNNLFEIIYLIDIKMDTGWFRNMIDKKAIEHSNRADDFTNAQSITYNDRNTNRKITFRTANNLHYDIVVITAANGPTNYANIVNIANSTNSNCKIWTLTDGPHPNTYEKTKRTQIKPSNDFCHFEQYLQSFIQPVDSL